MSAARDLGRYGTVGIDLLLGLAIGYYGGRYLDGRYAGGHGYLTAIGLGLGGLSAVRTFQKMAHAMRIAAEAEERAGDVYAGEPSYDAEYLEVVDRDRAAANTAKPGVPADATRDTAR
jgi:Putative F0F1-ATPase subunit Ca2+/Mg2+ transporter